MAKELSEKLKYDPSDIRQSFPDLNIRLHCCRYWLLTEWKCTNMAFPFWRLYHNSIGKASVIYKREIITLTADKIVIIPPNTSFSTSLKGVSDNRIQESIIGKKINKIEEVKNVRNNEASDHLFIHFNIGLPYDSLHPDIYTFPAEGYMNELLNEIKEFNIRGDNSFDFASCAAINCLILSLLKKIAKDKWEKPFRDIRITNAVIYIEQHLNSRLTNAMLSSKANMVANSFARIFKENTGVSIQQFVQKKRIENALLLLHHSTFGVDEIADRCGFFDRHHFSKVFKEQMSMSPIFYRKHLTFSF